MHRLSTAWAGIVGGLLYLFFGAAFAMTHDSTTYNRNDPWLGFDSFDYGEMSFILPLLLLWMTIGYGRGIVYAGRLGLLGVRLTQIGLLLQAAADIVSNNVIDAQREWNGDIGIGGWYLFLFSHLLLMIGMVLWGWSLKGNAQYRRLARLLFATVVFTLALFVVGEWMANHSDGSFGWELAAGLTYLPSGLCWLCIGMLSLRVLNESR